MRLNGRPWSGDQAKPSHPKTTSARQGTASPNRLIAWPSSGTGSGLGLEGGRLAPRFMPMALRISAVNRI